MRVIMKVSMPTPEGNAKVLGGTLDSTLSEIFADIKPEAVYFTAMDGKRTALVVLDLAEPSDMVRVAEPFFLGLNAGVEYFPAMVPADLQKAAPHFEKAVKEYGR